MLCGRCRAERGRTAQTDRQSWLGGHPSHPAHVRPGPAVRISHDAAQPRPEEFRGAVAASTHAAGCDRIRDFADRRLSRNRTELATTAIEPYTSMFVSPRNRT